MDRRVALYCAPLVPDRARLDRPLMGSMAFLLPNPLPAGAREALAEACVASTVGYYDQSPVPTQIQLGGDCLVLTREQNESGYLIVPWPVEACGTVVVSSTTLRERAEPYRLLVELARGKVNQVRTQKFEWESIGLQTSKDFEDALKDVTRMFGLAALAEGPAEADAQAARVLEKAHSLAEWLVRDYVDQMLTTRHQDGPLDTRLGARYARAPVGSAADDFANTFTSANVCIRWRDVEPNEAEYEWDAADAAVAAAQAAGLPVTIGPIIDLAPGMLPEWAAAWASDLPALATCMCDYLETVVNRYRGEVRRWIVCAGFNHADALGLVDDDRLRLAYRLFEAAAQVDSGLELILSVAQPWGDYLVNDDQTITPVTFPDDLIRAGVRLNAVELEFRAGTRPRGSLPRDLLDAARILDVFGTLGLNLEVALSFPSDEGPDPLATDHHQTVWKPGWRAGSGPSPVGQAEWGAAFAALALAWPNVRTVTWDHWSDADPHLIPHSGLLDAQGRPKPLLKRLHTLRTDHL